jgi:hypothetical protein
MLYVLPFHCNSCFKKTPQCYVIRIVQPVLLRLCGSHNMQWLFPWTVLTNLSLFSPWHMNPVLISLTSVSCFKWLRFVTFCICYWTRAFYPRPAAIFVNCIRLRNNLEVRYNALLLLHLRPATQPAITVVAICREMLAILAIEYPVGPEKPFGPILH